MSRFLAIPVLLALSGWLCLPLAQAADKKVDTAAEAAKRLTEITVERLGGKDGPEDTLTLRSDGTALYHGRSNVERKGRFMGTIPEHGFHDNFPLLAETYAELRGTPASTGKPTGGRVTPIRIRVVWDGKAEEIMDHCPGLDRRLWLLEMAAQGVAADVVWKKDGRKVP